MDISFLGTSAAIPTKSRNHPGIIIQLFGKTILLDCGEATQCQLTQAHISPMKIDEIYITHLHGDHILGLPGLIQSMAFRGRTKPLDIYGPYDKNQVLEQITKIGYFTLTYKINIHTISENGIINENENYNVIAFKTKHTVTNYSYKIEEKRQPKFIKQKALDLGIQPGMEYGKLQKGESITLNGKIITPEQVLGPPRKGQNIVYSGDTRPTDIMVKFSKDVDILIHEATFSDIHKSKAKENGHCTATEAATMAKEANVKQLVLTHLSNRYLNAKPLTDEAINIFKNTVYAYDLMKIILERNEIRIE
ncbi:MAG: ribonuclease Z [Methanobacteriaceae archaeon]|nr:ribonuclease Z [Methanobacteriaceae archaeon]